jgi:four helix bundle protein
VLNHEKKKIGFAKIPRYKKSFISKLIDCSGEAGETQVWLDFSLDFGYMDEGKHDDMTDRYDEVEKMLQGMIDKADKFCK